MSLLYPQLPLPAAIDLAQALRATPLAEAARTAETTHSAATFSPTGGRRTSERELNDLRHGLLAVAEANSFPNPAADAQRNAFDAEAAAYLHRKMDIAPAEASRGGIWSFLCCILVPELVRWRFPGAHGENTPPERFLAGRRNTLQRLWWRAEILRGGDPSDHYRLLRDLGEDEAVQIMERPTLAGCRPLSTTVAEELLAAAVRTPHIPRRVLVREAQKRIMRLASFISFDAMPQIQLREHVHRVFLQVEAAFEKSGAAASG